MEENEQNEQQCPAPEAAPEAAQETAPAAQEPQPEQAPEATPGPAPEAQPGNDGQPELQPLPDKPVKITVRPPESTEGSEQAAPYEKELEFHTPTMLAEVLSAPDKATVKIEITEYQTEKIEVKDGEPPKEPKVVVGVRTMFSGTKDGAVKAIARSCVAPQALPLELRKFSQFLIDHSSLKAVAVSLVCTDAEGKDAVTGFVLTARTCTKPQAVELVNCCDANVHEFVTQAKIEVPGRNAPKMGGLVIPTPEDKEKLGLK